MTGTLVVLAAGMSTRYGRLKQLEPVGPSGEALLDYAVFDGWRAGLSRVVLVIREELEPGFRDHVSRRWSRGMEVVFHHQRLDDLPGVAEPGKHPGPFKVLLEARRKPWGTAHAVLTAQSHLPGWFAVLNADDFYGGSALAAAARMMEETESEGPGGPPTFGLVAYRLLDTLSRHGGVNRGVVEVADGRWLRAVREILNIRTEDGTTRGQTLDGEELLLSNQALTSTNFWIFTPSIFPHLVDGFRTFLEDQDPTGSEPEFLIPTEINRLLGEGNARVRVLRASDPFFGITHPSDWDWVASGIGKLVEEGRYPSPLWPTEG